MDAPSGRMTLVTSIDLSPTKSLYECHVAILGDVDGDGIRDIGIATFDGPGYILFGSRDFPTKCSLSQIIVGLEREILTTCKARGRRRYGTEYRRRPSNTVGRQKIRYNPTKI